MSHRVIEEWLGEEVETLEDLLRPGLRAVAVGINPPLAPSLRSAADSSALLGGGEWPALSGPSPSVKFVLALVAGRIVRLAVKSLRDV